MLRPDEDPKKSKILHRQCGRKITRPYHSIRTLIQAQVHLIVVDYRLHLRRIISTIAQLHISQNIKTIYKTSSVQFVKLRGAKLIKRLKIIKGLQRKSSLKLIKGEKVIKGVEVIKSVEVIKGINKVTEVEEKSKINREKEEKAAKV